MNLHLNGLPPALAAFYEPGAHGFRQALRLHAETRFDKTFGNGKCVIELGFAGEVAHTKIVEPIEGASAALGAYNDVDAQLLSVHEASIAQSCM